MLLKTLGEAAANIDPAMLNGAIDMQMVGRVIQLFLQRGWPYSYQSGGVF